MEPIEKRITVNATVSKVWKALTEPAELEKWLMMKTTFKPEKGKEFIFKADPTEVWDGIFHCKVMELVENKKVVYTWNAGFLNTDTIVSISLKEVGNKTEVILVHSGWDKIAAGAEESRTAHNEGWDIRFVQKLKEVVEN